MPCHAYAARASRERAKQAPRTGLAESPCALLSFPSHPCPSASCLITRLPFPLPRPAFCSLASRAQPLPLPPSHHIPFTHHYYIHIQPASQIDLSLALAAID